MQPNRDPFYALADPTRREILMMLSKDSLPINSLAENFDMSRPAVSKHIKILSESGFISITEYGRERYCELNSEGFKEVNKWVNFFEQFWPKKMKKLEGLLKKRGKG
ncbi:MAG: metalloregulator ArsR/SmtB family transcription factor [Chitinophagales bacterium]